MTKITPVLLCGGSGTRLWPLSRKSFPKQFARLAGGQTLFQAALGRLSGPGYAAPVILTGEDFRFLVAEQAQAAGIAPATVIIEPSARNTGPAILAAALHLAAIDPDALMLVAPSDHVVPDAAAFRAAVEAGVQAARDGQIVTFGICPTRAETGYGWLDLGETPTDFAPRPLPLLRFVEKPCAERAEAMLAAGSFLWNAGIFLASAAVLVAAFAAHAPGLLPGVRAAIAGARRDPDFLRLAAGPWAAAEDISVDYAVMERASNLCVVPFGAGWSDLGDWDAIWREGAPDASGVVKGGAVTAIDCTDSLLRSEAEGIELVGIGLSDIVAIAMPDAVLIAHRGRVQEVKLAVARLKAKAAPQAESFAQRRTPWGWSEAQSKGARHEVRRVHVAPGGVIEMHCHLHRTEHWTIVGGTARVTIEGASRLISEGQSVEVPVCVWHQLENPGLVALDLIEVRTGGYLEEDDNQRPVQDFAIAAE